MEKGMIQLPRLPHIGMRIIKSALGVMICFAIYFLRGKEGTPFYSALAVLWCIQNQSKNTVQNALQRTVGTGIGALYGLIYILIKGQIKGIGDSFLHYFIISMVLIPIIYTTVVLKQKKASYFSCVVFLSIVVNHLMDENPYIFVANRSLDTLIGIFVGLILNSIYIHGRIDRETLFIADLDKSMDGSMGGVTSFGKIRIGGMLEKGMKLTILSYSSDDYKGYSYIKIYNKNASVQNMADYLKTMTSASQIVTMSDNRRNRADFIFSDCNTMVRKLHYMFNWSPRRSSANNINLLHHASDV